MQISKTVGTLCVAVCFALFLLAAGAVGSGTNAVAAPTSDNTLQCTGGEIIENSDALQSCTISSATGTCYERSTSPVVVQICTFEQVGAPGDRHANATQIIESKEGAPLVVPVPGAVRQDGTQVVTAHQTGGTASNSLSVSQVIKQKLGPGNLDDDEENELEPAGSPPSAAAILQSQESHQNVFVDQATTSAVGNSSDVSQFLKQRERASHSPVSITQHQNLDNRGSCSASDDPDANMCVIVNQTSGGTNVSKLSEDYRQFQRAHDTPDGKQLQGDVTPFRGGEVDTRALDALVEAQIAGGIDALVPCGSTGEAATLTHEEHLAVVRAVVRVARGRVPVIAGTGSNSTAEAIRLTRGAEEAGADAALLISPYYNRPTQEGIYRHYTAVAEASRLPLIVYNIPGRTGSNITPDTLARLARIPNVVGVKEASGNLAQVLEIIHAAGPDFGVYSGDDILTLPIMAAGGRGVIAVGANLMPRAYAELTDALLAGDLERARTLSHRLLPLMLAMTLEVNPIPVKTALALMGRCADEFRLPLTPMSAPARAKLEAVLREYELV